MVFVEQPLALLGSATHALMHNYTHLNFRYFKTYGSKLKFGKLVDVKGAPSVSLMGPEEVFKVKGGFLCIGRSLISTSFPYPWESPDGDGHSIRRIPRTILCLCYRIDLTNFP